MSEAQVAATDDDSVIRVVLSPLSPQSTELVESCIAVTAPLAKDLAWLAAWYAVVTAVGMAALTGVAVVAFIATLIALTAAAL